MRPFRLFALAFAAPAVILITFPHATASESNSSGTTRVFGPPRAAGYVMQQSAGPSIQTIKESKLSSELALLASITEAGGAAATLMTEVPLDQLPPAIAGALAQRRMRLTAHGYVQVYIEVASSGTGTLTALRDAGARIQRVDMAARIVQAEAAVADLGVIATLPAVERVRLPGYPAPNIGSVITEGDAITNADSVRAAAGLSGAGITVGVIADGIGGLEESQVSGDLPDDVDIDTCNVVQLDPHDSGSEGTAMLEIVHDMAPNAHLLFGNFGFGTSMDFNAAVDCVTAHADVVVDDINFFGVGPYDGTSNVSQHTAGALNGPDPVRGYYTAAGNWATSHYQGVFADSGSVLVANSLVWTLHEFDTSNAPVTLHEGLNPAPATVNRIRLRPNASATLVLVWDDSWGSSDNDYDLLFSTGGNASVCSADRQDGVGSDNPREVCSLRNNGTAIADIDIMFGNVEGLAEPREFDFFVTCDSCVELHNRTILDFDTPGSSIANQADAGGAPASVVAVSGVRYQSPVTIEVFSSRGPTEDGRTKPEIVAPSGVCVSGAGGFGAGSTICQGSGRRFSGTSAAAPHIAAIAALLLECLPTLGREALRHAILDFAEDLGAAREDDIFGFGLADAWRAVGSLACVVPTPTPLPTPTATPDCIAGDVNHSGRADSIDAALVLQFTASLVSTIDCATNADVNTDGSINSIDAALILQYGAGLIASLPV